MASFSFASKLRSRSRPVPKGRILMFYSKILSLDSDPARIHKPGPTRQQYAAPTLSAPVATLITGQEGGCLSGHCPGPPLLTYMQHSPSFPNIQQVGVEARY